MSDTMATDPAAYWNDEAGHRWVRTQHLIDGMFADITAQLLEVGGATEGERALDIGCGCGTTTLALAQRVGTRGDALGVDVSGPMLDEARRKAQTQGSNARFLLADAQVHAFEAGAADLAFSRFGVMFFIDSRQAFANIGSGLRSGGRCVFACWRGLADNPWMTGPAELLADLLPPPQPPADPDTPGPLRFADPDYTRGMMTEAGYVDIRCDRLDAVVRNDGTVDEIVEFSRQLGPLRVALESLAPEVLDEALERVRTGIAEQHDGRGVANEAGLWFVQARVP